MRFGTRGALILLCLPVMACGQSTRAVDGAGGSGGNSVGCVAGPELATWLEETPLSLPARLEGELCDEQASLTLGFAGTPVPPEQEPIELGLVEGAGNYSVSLFGVDGGALVALDQSGQGLALSPSSPSVFFSVRTNGLDDDRVIAELTGTPGPVVVDITRPELEPYPEDCVYANESLPVETPPLALPARLAAELCHARDSRVFAIEVTAGKEVWVTLEDPKAIDSFAVGIFENDGEYVPLAVESGATRWTLGLLAKSSLTFTPVESGVVGVSVTLGSSRGDGFALLVEQR
ncbi:MAG TPA: hypothetical protein VGK73_11635 [Polyangiaceae bacterium]